MRDAIIQNVEGLDPVYLDLVNEVAAAFENHDTKKCIGFFRVLLNIGKTEDQRRAIQRF